MRVLFDLKHPVDVHFFRHAVRALQERGDRVLITVRPKDETVALLESMGIPHRCLSPMGSGLVGMGAELAWRSALLADLACRFRPDVMVAKTGISVAWVGRALRVPSVVFEDTEFAWFQIALCAPFATVMCTGWGYGRSFPGKELRYDAPLHMAYTHPRRFRPRRDVLEAAGVDPDGDYAVLRVKAWRALHDRGVRGLSLEQVESLVEALARRCRPIISSERELPRGLRSCANPLPVEQMLHLLAFARLYVGEGSCMAAEAACLGTPAIYVSPSSRRGYLDAIERRVGTVTTVQTFEDALRTARRWLDAPEIKERAALGRRRLAEACEDPVEFMLEVIDRTARRH